MARPKGYMMTAEQKARISATKTKRKDTTSGKYQIQTLYINGNEKDAFDFWPLIRNVMRPIGQFNLLHIIEKEIANEKIWDDISKVKNVLSKYFHVIEKKGVS